MLIFFGLSLPPLPSIFSLHNKIHFRCFQPPSLNSKSNSNNKFYRPKNRHTHISLIECLYTFFPCSIKTKDVSFPIPTLSLNLALPGFDYVLPQPSPIPTYLPISEEGWLKKWDAVFHPFYYNYYALSNPANWIIFHIYAPLFTQHHIKSLLTFQILRITLFSLACTRNNQTQLIIDREIMNHWKAEQPKAWHVHNRNYPAAFTLSDPSSHRVASRNFH